MDCAHLALTDEYAGGSSFGMAEELPCVSDLLLVNVVGTSRSSYEEN